MYIFSVLVWIKFLYIEWMWPVRGGAWLTWCRYETCPHPSEIQVLFYMAHITCVMYVDGMVHKTKLLVDNNTNFWRAQACQRTRGTLTLHMKRHVNRVTYFNIIVLRWDSVMWQRIVHILLHDLPNGCNRGAIHRTHEVWREHDVLRAKKFISSHLSVLIIFEKDIFQIQWRCVYYNKIELVMISGYPLERYIISCIISSVVCTIQFCILVWYVVVVFSIEVPYRF